MPPASTHALCGGSDLHCVPLLCFGADIIITAQDNLCTRGVQTTAGSRVLRGHVPAYDATAVARLRAAGAVLVGKTNMDSFGMGSSTENSDFGVRSGANNLRLGSEAVS